VERESSRPDFQIVLYPAIPKTLTFATDNPPAFLACGNQDRANISEGLATLYLNMKKAGINAELHIYSSVGHGFGYRPKSGSVRLAGWLVRLKEWMTDLKLMDGKE
jgi:acetyl esterase/lipase